MKSIYDILYIYIFGLALQKAFFFSKYDYKQPSLKFQFFLPKSSKKNFFSSKNLL